MKYILLLAAVLFTSLCYGQGIWNKSATNTIVNRGKDDSVRIIPRDTLPTNNALYNGSPVGNYGRIAAKHGKFYFHDSVYNRRVAFFDDITRELGSYTPWKTNIGNVISERLATGYEKSFESSGVTVTPTDTAMDITAPNTQYPNNFIRDTTYGISMCENFTIILKFKALQKSASAAKIGVGILGTGNTFAKVTDGYIVNLTNSTATSFIRPEFSNDSLPFASNGFDYSINDSLQITATKKRNVTSIMLYNITTGKRISYTKVMPWQTGVRNTSTAGWFSMFFSNGSFRLYDFRVINNDTGLPLFLLFGDSITQGYSSNSADNADNWSGRLNLLSRERVEILAKQASTSYELVNMSKEIDRYRPRFYGVMIGGNDTLAGIPLSTTISNLKTFREGVLLKNSEARFVWFANTPRVPHDRNVFIAKLNSAIQIAFPNDQYVDVWTPLVEIADSSLKPAYQIDDDHPNIIGHRIIANVAKKLMGFQINTENRDAVDTGYVNYQKSPLDSSVFYGPVRFYSPIALNTVTSNSGTFNSLSIKGTPGNGFLAWQISAGTARHLNLLEGTDDDFTWRTYDNSNNLSGVILRIGRLTQLVEITGTLKVGAIYIFTGTGSPQGVISAPVGSTFHRTDGGAGTSFYVKESGSGNTGWAAK